MFKVYNPISDLDLPKVMSRNHMMLISHLLTPKGRLRIPVTSLKPYQIDSMERHEPHQPGFCRPAMFRYSASKWVLCAPLLQLVHCSASKNKARNASDGLCARQSQNQATYRLQFVFSESLQNLTPPCHFVSHAVAGECTSSSMGKYRPQAPCRTTELTQIVPHEP